MVKTTLSNASQISQSVEATAKNLEEQLRKAFYEELLFQIRSPLFSEPLIEEAARVLYTMQEAYWGGSGSVVIKEDPTQLGNPEQVAKLRMEILQNLQKTTVNSVTGEIKLVLISDAFMGTGGDKNSTGPGIPWLHYFIYGHLDGNLIWVNPTVYEILKGHSAGHLGRFGIGYMWQLGPGEATEIQVKLDHAAKQGGPQIKLSDLVHGQSGKAGNESWFSDILNKIDWDGLVVRPATERALKRVAMGQISK